MSETITPTILDCNHVEIRDGKCATTDCHNFVDLDPSWDYRLPEQYRG